MMLHKMVGDHQFFGLKDLKSDVNQTTFRDPKRASNYEKLTLVAKVSIFDEKNGGFNVAIW